MPRPRPIFRPPPRSYAAPLNPAESDRERHMAARTINPGSSVEVTVAYALRPSVLPISSHTLTLQSTARERIAQ